MHISNSVFSEARFWLMVAISVVLPFGIYGGAARQAGDLAQDGAAAGLLAGGDRRRGRYLPAAAGRRRGPQPSPVDDSLFVSEVRVALYLLPALFAGLGINVISHVLTTHLAQAEKRFAERHRRSLRRRAAAARRSERVGHREVRNDRIELEARLGSCATVKPLADVVVSLAVVFSGM